MASYLIERHRPEGLNGFDMRNFSHRLRSPRRDLLADCGGPNFTDLGMVQRFQRSSNDLLCHGISRDAAKERTARQPESFRVFAFRQQNAINDANMFLLLLPIQFSIVSAADGELVRWHPVTMAGL